MGHCKSRKDLRSRQACKNTFEQEHAEFAEIISYLCVLCGLLFKKFAAPLPNPEGTLQESQRPSQPPGLQKTFKQEHAEIAEKNSYLCFLCFLLLKKTVRS